MDESARPTPTWLKPTQALNRIGSLPSAKGAGSKSYEYARYGFRIGSLGLLIEPGQASEIVQRPVIYPLPNTASWLKGLVNLRGNLVPVLDLHLLLDIPEQADARAAERSLLLVLGKGEDALALGIDGLPQSVDLSAPLPQAPPLPNLLREHQRGAYVDDDCVWLEVDVQAMVRTLSGHMAA